MMRQWGFAARIAFSPISKEQAKPYLYRMAALNHEMNVQIYRERGVNMNSYAPRLSATHTWKTFRETAGMTEVGGQWSTRLEKCQHCDARQQRRLSWNAEGVLTSDVVDATAPDPLPICKPPLTPEERARRRTGRAATT